MKSFTIVTTFKDIIRSADNLDLKTLNNKAKRHWEKNPKETISFGMRFCEQAERHLPYNVKVLVYYEGDNLPQNTSKVTFVPHVLDKVEKFKTISKDRYIQKKFTKYDYEADSKIINRLNYDYEFDAVRFCHPPFALLDALDKINTRYLISMDSDVQIHRDIPPSFFDSLVEEDAYVYYLSRYPHKHMESGFIIWDTEYECHEQWWDHYRKLYDDGLIYSLFDGWTDCHAFDHVNKILYPKSHHIAKVQNNAVWQASPLQEYMSHYKGVAI